MASSFSEDVLYGRISNKTHAQTRMRKRRRRGRGGGGGGFLKEKAMTVGIFLPVHRLGGTGGARVREIEREREREVY